MNVITHIVYLLISSIVIIHIGNTCYRNGEVYICNYFPSQKDFSNRINRLLRVAYYLLNIGLAVFCLYNTQDVQAIPKMISELSEMIGFILLVIGVLHFGNIITIYLLYKHFKN